MIIYHANQESKAMHFTSILLRRSILFVETDMHK